MRDKKSQELTAQDSLKIKYIEHISELFYEMTVSHSLHGLRSIPAP